MPSGRVLNGVALYCTVERATSSLRIDRVEDLFRYEHREQARNAAIAWVEARGARFGLYRKIEIGRLGTFKGAEVGVSSRSKPFWRLRIDNDVAKVPHYNPEFGEGLSRSKDAFCFPSLPETVAKLARRRAPR